MFANLKIILFSFAIQHTLLLSHKTLLMLTEITMISRYYNNCKNNETLLLCKNMKNMQRNQNENHKFDLYFSFTSLLLENCSSQSQYFYNITNENSTALQRI